MTGTGPFPARLVATHAAALDPVSADAPNVLHWPGRRLLVQRGDTQLAVRVLDDEGKEVREVRFPAPWPRQYGSVTVSPLGEIAVFAGVHALRAVNTAGAILWEIRHGCWSAAVCEESHASFAEYADDYYHSTADQGSAAFSSDGKHLWAHVRKQTENHAEDEAEEEWLVINSADGTVAARADTMTVGSASFPFPHPDPAQMGLTVAEGEEESPVLWGRWDGTKLTVERYIEEVLLDISPSGEHFLSTDPGQWSLYLHRVADGEELRRLNAADGVPPESTESDGRVCWDYQAAFPYDNLAVAGTDGYAGTPRHWLIDPGTLAVRGRIAYPIPVSGSPLPAGQGMWGTVSEDKAALYLWTLA